VYNLLIEILKVGGIAALALVIVFFLLKDSVLTATPRKFTHASGYFEKVGNFWYEFPGNIPFVESGRGGIYLHLIDHGRVKDRDPAHPFTLRMPLPGGMSQWSFPNPWEWRDLYIVKPENR